MIKSLIAVFYFCTSILLSTAVHASETLELQLIDKKGKPLVEAVVTLTPSTLPPSWAKPTTSVVDQLDKEFVPAVSVVPSGTLISFPNQDNILHHVYSFSNANTFDLPLYKGMPSEPVLFSEPGLVTLGCNIHDWMKAYVLVVDTPYYQISDDTGKVMMEGLPKDEYTLEVWHPRQRETLTQTLNLQAAHRDTITIAVKPQLRSRRHSSGQRERYN